MLKKNLGVFVAIICLTAQVSIAQISIENARQQAVGSEVTVRGVVTNGPELGIIRYMQDPTGGMAIYSSSFTQNLQPGDSIEVTGTLDDFQGLLEINPVASLTTLQSGVSLPDTQIVTNAALNESLESELVRLNGVVFQAGGSAFSPNTSYSFTQGTGTGSLYIRTNSPLAGQMIPVGTIDLVGICSEYNGQYQMLARSMSDFILPEGIAITSPVTVTDFQQTSATITWQTNIEGSTSILYGKTPNLELGLLTDATPVTSHTYTLNNLQPGFLYYFMAFSSANGNSSSAPVKVFGTVSTSSGWIRAWFNHPVANHPEAFAEEALDDTLIYYLNQADSSIDFTIYDFDNSQISNISEALNAAWNRGVRVRFISDGNLTATNFGVNDLLPEIPKITSPVGENFTIMHNKFVVIDANHPDANKPLVWTGSTNFTDRQVNRDPNNVVLIQDQTLARTYQAEFEEMWGSNGDLPDTSNSKFGNQKTDNTPHEFKINGNRVECYFSPSDNTNDALIRTLRTANDSVYFATMLITRFDIKDAIDSLYQDNVFVRGIINSDTTTLVYDELLQIMGENLLVNPDTQVIMHHKYFTCDAGTSSDPLVWTGSHNWSNNANTRNDENSLVIHDAQIAALYRNAFIGLITEVPEDTTSIFSIESVNILQVFPCPAIAQNGISIRSQNSGLTDVFVHDVSGRLITSTKLNITEKEACKINFPSEIRTGNYFLTVIQSNRRWTTKIQIIQSSDL